jgi:hypothetical protein
MTSQISSLRRAFTGALASGVVATGLLAGFGSATAHADVLDDIYAQYETGTGGGQVSNLIHSAMKLRALGYRPSKGNMEDLEAGMADRPNQGPLIEALQNTVAFQKRNRDRGMAQQAPQTSNLPPGLNPSGVMVGPPGVQLGG